MTINELVTKCHHAAIDKGFYECSTCEGKGNAYHDETGIETCPDCRGFGINRDRNISELLMLIVSELGECQEALRHNYFSIPISHMDISQIENKYFEKYIKNSVEDELADTFIRLFDLCGYLNINIEKHIEAKIRYNESRPKKHNKMF